MLFNQDRAHQLLQEHGLDGLVAATPRNFYYVSEYWNHFSLLGNIESFFAAVVPADSQVNPCVVIPESHIGGLLLHPTWIPEVRPVEFQNTSRLAREPEPVEPKPLAHAIGSIAQEKVVADLAQDQVHGVRDALVAAGMDRGRVAFDDLRLAAAVSALLPGLTAVDGFDLLNLVRKIKTPEEVARLRRGAEINQEAVESVLPLIHPGQRWITVAQGFQAYVDAQPDTVLLETDQALQFGTEFEGEYYPDVLLKTADDWAVRGDAPIIFETWGAHRNYKFDFSRTVFPGTPDQAYVDMCARIHDVWQTAIIEHLRPGTTTAELFRRSLALMDVPGVPTPRRTIPFFHGVGLDLIEQPAPYPTFGPTKSWTLEPGVVVNCELLYFGHVHAPFHIESTFLITDDGAECFQTLAPDLIVLGR